MKKISRLAPFALAFLLTGAVAQGAVSGATLFEKLSPAERQLLMAATGMTEAHQFLPGQLLAGLPYPAPALPDQQIVGSVESLGGSRVIVRTSLGQAAAQAAAEKALRAAGWQDQYPQGGVNMVFESRQDNALYQSPLCKPGVAGSLNVFAASVPAGATQVAYQYNPYPVSESCPANLVEQNRTDLNFYAPYREQTPHNPAGPLEKRGLKLPSLPAPDDAEVTNTSTTSGDTQFSAYTSVYSAKTTEALRQHYVSALQSQGWQLVDTRMLAGQSVTRLTFKIGTQEAVSTLSLKARTDLKDPARLPRHDIQWEVRWP